MSTTPGDGLKNDFADLESLTTGWLDAVANFLAYTRWPNVSQTVTDSGDTDISDAGNAQDEYRILRLGGALSNTRNVIVRTLVGGWWFVRNGTTGGFAVTVKTSGGTGIAIPNGAAALLFCDGANVVDALSFLSSLTIGAGGTPILSVLVGSKTWDPANMATDGSVTSTTVTVTGAAVGDPCFASLSTIGANNVLISAHVSSAGTVTVVLENRTGGALDIASGTLRVTCFHH
jgi:hypothetical protein